MPAQSTFRRPSAPAKAMIFDENQPRTKAGIPHLTTRGDHTLNVRMLWFRGRVEREEPAMLALDLLSRERLDDALDVVDTALAQTPDDAELLLVAARVHLARAEYERARGYCIAAARTSRTWAEPFAWLARIVAAEGRPTKAAEVAERAVLLGCKDRDIVALDAPRSAQRKLAGRVKQYLASPEMDEPALLILALESAGRIEEALRVLDVAVRREPDDEDLGAAQARLLGIDPSATAIDIVVEEQELDDDAREEAFFRSLGISEKPRFVHEPSVIVSDTLLGEPAPRVHAVSEKSEVRAKSEPTQAIPLVQLAPRGKRTGWLPRVGFRAESGPSVQPTTVRVAPMANVARRDPTLRFWLGR